MPNIGTLLKEEIARISRKESRRLVEPLKKQVAAQRKDIAALKRERTELRSQVTNLGKAAKRVIAAEPASAGEGNQRRFSASGLRSMRKKLGVSAEEFGRLVGVSGQSVYNWEQGKARPRQAQLDRIAALRGVGKREAAVLLEAVPAAASTRAAGKKAGRKPARKAGRKAGARKAARKAPGKRAPGKRAAAKKAGRKGARKGRKTAAAKAAAG